MKTIYEKHPVSTARKDELRSQGYKIVDARFAPKDYKHPDTEQQAKSTGQRAAKPAKPDTEQQAE